MRSKVYATILVILTTTVARVQGQEGDPSGFVGLLNAARAQRGLSPVAHNPQAVGVARANNQAQAAHGLGHHVLGGFGQCAGVGVGEPVGALSMWLASPPHAAILLNPSLASVGFDVWGNCATVATASAAMVFPSVQPAAWTYQVPVRYYYPAPIVWSYP